MNISLAHSAEPIIPAVLAGTIEEFNKKLEFARKIGSAHFDVMDGEFVDGSCIPIDKWPDKIDVNYSEAHLMVKDPLDYLDKLAAKGIRRAIVHIEDQVDLEKLKNMAKAVDILLGFAVNPDTDLYKLKPYVETNTYIQLMGVHPGLANQEMLDYTPSSVNYLRKSTIRRVIISIDGGVTEDNILQLKKNGADYFVSTHAIFSTPDWQDNYDKLLAAAKDEVRV